MTASLRLTGSELSADRISSLYWRYCLIKSSVCNSEPHNLATAKSWAICSFPIKSPPSMEELYHRKEVLTMTDLLEMSVPKEEQKEVKEFVTTLLMLSKEDRAILLSNANAFKVRMDIERARR